jgi:hypothetical protein
VAGGSLSAVDFSGGGFWGYGIAVAFATAGMIVVLRSATAEAVAGAYLLVPASVSLMLAVEWAVGPLGPQPMILGAVVAAALCTIAGVVVLWGGARARVSEGAGATGRGAGRVLAFAAVALGMLAVGAAVVALSQPAMTASVSGLRTDGSDFKAAFDLFGYEVAGPWLALGIAGAALGIALEGRRIRATWGRVLALAVAAGAWWFAADTPLRTLTTFIPSDVQVDYGSEFARIDFAGDPSAWAIAAVAGALVAVGLTWAGRALAPAAHEDGEAAEVAGS